MCTQRLPVTIHCLMRRTIHSLGLKKNGSTSVDAAPHSHASSTAERKCRLPSCQTEAFLS